MCAVRCRGGSGTGFWDCRITACSAPTTLKGFTEREDLWSMLFTCGIPERKYVLNIILNCVTVLKGDPSKEKHSWVDI